MIRAFFIGRVGKDGAKVIEGANGNFMSVDVATDIYSKGQNKPMWIRLRSSRPNHIKLAQYLTKGKLIEVLGSQVEPNVWIDKDGNPRSQVVIVVDNINFISTGQRKNQEESAPNVPTVTVTAPVEQPEGGIPFDAPNDKADDLPF